MKTEQLTLYRHRKKETEKENRTLKRATINIHKGLLGTCKTRELMHDGGEMTTTDSTGGTNGIKNNLRYIK